MPHSLPHDTQLLALVLLKYPNLQHLSILDESDDHSPISVMASSWKVLHDELPVSEHHLRELLMRRAQQHRDTSQPLQSHGLQPTAAPPPPAATTHHAPSAGHHQHIGCYTCVRGGVLHTQETHKVQGDSETRSELSGGELEEELQGIFDTPWPCADVQYEQRLHPKQAVKLIVVVLSLSPSHLSCALSTSRCSTPSVNRAELRASVSRAARKPDAGRVGFRLRLRLRLRSGSSCAARARRKGFALTQTQAQT